MRRILFFMVMLFPFFVSCGNDKGDCAEFSALLDSLNFDAKSDSSCFLVIPSFSCRGCVQTTWRFLSEHQDQIELENDITIIDSYCLGDDPFALDLPFNVVKDSCSFVEKTAYRFANPTVVKTKDGMVLSVVSTQANQIEEILSEQFAISKK